jgi:ribonuclease E
VRRGRGRRVRVERRVIPVTHVEERRHEVFERELWRIAVEFLDWGEQHMWAALAGARVAPSGWRRARAMLHFDKSGELKRRFLLTAVERNKNSQLRVRALQEIAVAKDPEAFQAAVDIVGSWPRDEKREGVKVLLQALAEKRIGRRDQASQWIWDLADMTREVHEEYAVQRWPETKRLLGLLVNSSGGAHARNARRLVHAARKQDRRLSAAILAAAVAHTPEAMEVVRGARTRMARKPSALSRELLRNFPKRKNRSRRRRKKGDDVKAPQLEGAVATTDAIAVGVAEGAEGAAGEGQQQPSRKKRRRSRRNKNGRAGGQAEVEAGAAQPAGEAGEAPAEPRAPAPALDTEEAARGIEAAAALLAAAGSTATPQAGEERKPSRRSRRKAEAERPATDDGEAPEAPETGRGAPADAAAAGEASAETDDSAGAVADAPAKPAARRRRTPVAKPATDVAEVADADGATAAEVAGATDEAPAKPAARRRRAPVAKPDAAPAADAPEDEAPAKPKPRARRTAAKKVAEADAEVAEEKPKRKRATKAKAAEDEAPEKPKRKRATKAKAAEDEAPEKPKRKRATKAKAAEDEAPEKPKRKRATPKKAAGADAEDAPKPRKKRAVKSAQSEQLSLDGTAPEGEDAPKPRRARRKAGDAEPSARELDDAA